jgi:hypothetical protein
MRPRTLVAALFGVAVVLGEEGFRGFWISWPLAALLALAYVAGHITGWLLARYEEQVLRAAFRLGDRRIPIPFTPWQLRSSSR